MNEQNKIRKLQRIAELPFTYNRDINQHIGSCRISMDLINEKDQNLKEYSQKLSEQEDTIKKFKKHISHKEEQLRQKDDEKIKKDKFNGKTKI